MTDSRLQYPATERNRDAILGVLRGVLPATGLVLEIASGSGEHIVHFARACPGLTFQPSDPEDAALQSIAAWAQHTGIANVLPPVMLDAAGRARKATSSATSSGCTRCPVGTVARMSSMPTPSSRKRPAAISVSTQPGQTAFTVMPRGASRSAKALVSPTTPCLAAQ